MAPRKTTFGFEIGTGSKEVDKGLVQGAKTVAKAAGRAYKEKVMDPLAWKITDVVAPAATKAVKAVEDYSAGVVKPPPTPVAPAPIPVASKGAGSIPAGMIQAPPPPSPPNMVAPVVTPQQPIVGGGSNKMYPTSVQEGVDQGIVRLDENKPFDPTNLNRLRSLNLQQGVLQGQEMTSPAAARLRGEMDAQGAGQLFGSMENRQRGMRQFGLRAKWDAAKEAAEIAALPNQEAVDKYKTEKERIRMSTPQYMSQKLQSDTDRAIALSQKQTAQEQINYDRRVAAQTTKDKRESEKIGFINTILNNSALPAEDKATAIADIEARYADPSAPVAKPKTAIDPVKARRSADLRKEAEKRFPNSVAEQKAWHKLQMQQA